MVIGQVSWETELFKSVDLYLGDGLEMAGHLVMMQGRDSTQSLLIDIMVLNCMSLCATWQNTWPTGANLIIVLEMVLKQRK